MTKRFYPIILFTLLTSLPLSTMAEELVAQFSGSRSTTTAEFEVQAPWILDWRVNGEHDRTMGIDVAMFNAGTSIYEGIILKTKIPGNGVKMFNKKGKFYLRIDAALMDWTFKVIQLSKEEAELYTPKSEHILDN